MNPEIVSKQEFDLACQELVVAYFDRFPNSAFQYLVDWGLNDLLKHPIDTQNKPGGWAGGVVHLVAQRTRPVNRCVLNAEMEETFGVSFDTIRARAVQVADRIDLEQLDIMASAAELRGAFHGGHMEIVSESGERSQLSDHEMKRLMIQASNLFGEFLIARANHAEGT